MAGRWFPALRSALGFDGRPNGIETKAYGGALVGQPYASTRVLTNSRADGWNMDATAEAYERGIWTFKSIELISGHASRLPFRIGRDPDGLHYREVLDDHPLYRVLNRRANPLETARAFRKRLSAQVLLSKPGAFVEVTRSRAGTITRLDLLPPDRVRPVISDSGEYLTHFEYTPPLTGGIRDLAPERVRWIRDPHPFDPFSGVSPLEPAGMSAELDYLYRLYNVSFVRNDGRPGGILGVETGVLDADEMDRIEQRFGPGADNAGRMTVIGTGPDGISYTDTSAKPRDMAYEHATKTAKQEVLAAFGVPESLFGNASERTYANADKEEYNFWSTPMLPHLDLIASAFDEDAGDEWVPHFDVSTVDALEYPRRQRRAEAREEVSAGIRSIDEYRPLAGLTPFEKPQSRALWIAPSKAPIPLLDEDAAALGITGPPSTDPATPDAGASNPPDTSAADHESGAAAAAVDAERGAQADGPLHSGEGAAADAVAQERTASGGLTGDGAAQQAVSEARGDTEETAPSGLAEQALRAARLETKTYADSRHAYTLEEAEIERAAAPTAVVLIAQLTRLQSIVAARLRSPKARKHTPFWIPDATTDDRAGTSPLDVAKAVDVSRWKAEISETIRNVLQAPAAAVAGDLTRALTAVHEQDRAATHARFAVAAAAEAGATAVATFLDEVTAALDAVQEHTTDISVLDDALRAAFDERAHQLAESVASTAARAALAGAVHAAAAAASGEHVVARTWSTGGNELDRPDHAALDGLSELVTTPFNVGGFPLRHPADPLAPLALTTDCTCHCRYETWTMTPGTDGGWTALGEG